MVVCFKYNKLSDEDKKICLEGNPLECLVLRMFVCDSELNYDFFFQIRFLSLE